MRLISSTARLLAATAIFVTSAPAFAAINGLESADTTLISNSAGSTIQGDRKGIFSTGPELNLDNAGTIRGNGVQGGTFNPDAGVVINGGPAYITNSGNMSGARFGITTTYVFYPDDTYAGLAIGSVVNNSGSIIGDTDDGIRLIGGGTVTNSGYIAGRVGAGADGISMFAFDTQDTSGFTSIGTVDNLLGGTIEGHRFGVIQSSGGTINNAGTIKGGTDGAILIQSLDAGKIGMITNSGTILGNVGLNQLANASVVNSGLISAGNGTAVGGDSPLTITNLAAGTITGSEIGIRGLGPSLTVNNAGSIRGNGFRGGSFNPNGGVVFNGGPAYITNSGNIAGSRFGITTAAYSFTIDDFSVGRAIGSTVNNSGSIIGESDKGIRLIGGGSVTNSGYIAGRVGATADGVGMFAYDTQDTSASTGIGSVTNLAGGIIEGNRFGVILTGGGTIANAGTISGNAGSIHIQSVEAGKIGTITNSSTLNGAVTLYNLASGMITNSGSITAGSGAAVANYNGPLTLDNSAGGVITGATAGLFSDSPLTLTNAGTIRGNGLDGSILNPDGGVVIAGTAAPIVNRGTISGGAFGITTTSFFNDVTGLYESRAIGSVVNNSGSIIGDTDDGIRLIGGGTVTNSGYIAGRVGAGADGISMFAFDTQDTSGFTSIGTVDNLLGGTIEGHRFGVIQSSGGTINNAGTIKGGTDGAILIQSLDAGKIGTIINSGAINGTTGFIQLASANVTNSGSMTSANGAAVQSDSLLTLTNAATGSITGSTTGISANGFATIANTGTIYGLNSAILLLKAGVGSGVSNYVVNSGSILSPNGNAIDLLNGTIRNSGQIIGANNGILFHSRGGVYNESGGLIQAINSGGSAVTLLNGGIIDNSGTISGALFLNGGASSASVSNSGTINGYIHLQGLDTAVFNRGVINSPGGTAIEGNTVTRAVSFVNSGTVNGGTSTAVSLSGSNDFVELQTGSSISGAIDGGAGIDDLSLSGTTNTATPLQTVGRFLNFENLNVYGGYWTAPTTTGSFNATTVRGGTLAINGSITSPILVNYGGTIGGTGTINGNVLLGYGGTFSPGNSIGTINVTGGVHFTPGSIFSVQTSPSGASDRLAVNGAVTIDTGAQLNILAGIANYAPSTTYTILTATGGIIGKFDKAVTDYAYFNISVNTQKKGTIAITLAPNGKPLPSAAIATTLSAATAVSSLGVGNPIYQAVLMQSLPGARQAFTSLSGSGYGQLDALMANDFGHLHLNLTSSGSSASDVAWSAVSSIAARGFHSESTIRRGPISLMMVGGRYDNRLSTESLTADVQTRFMASAFGYQSGRFNAWASATAAWHDVSVGRTVSFPRFNDSSRSRYEAQTHRLDMEASYALARGAFNLAPYGGYSRIMINSPAFQEAGGLTALAFNRESRSIDQIRVGFQARSDIHWTDATLSPHIDLSVQRAWGDLASAKVARFAGRTDSFDSFGSSLSSRQIAVDAGVDLVKGPITIDASYRGQFGNQWRDHSAQLSAGIHF